MKAVAKDSILGVPLNLELALKRILLVFLPVLIMAELAISQIPNMAPDWPYRSQSRYFAVYALGRIADKGSEMHLFYNTMMGEIHKFNLDGSFSTGWPIVCDTLIFGSDPVVLDIDHDGLFEMFTDGARRIDGAYAYSLLFLIDENGTVMPGFPIRDIDPDGLAAADMDNDNEYELIYFSRRGGTINCLDKYSNPKPGWPISYPSDINCAAGSIGDLDSDGNNEFIIIGDRNIYAFRYDGTMMPDFSVTPEQENFAFYGGVMGNTLADIDNDGYLEIITAGDNWMHWPPPVDSSFIAIYDYTGQPKPGWPRYFPYAIISPVTPSDINNDGNIELAYQSLYLYFIDLNGEDVPGWPILLTGPTGEVWVSYSELCTVDLNGDDRCEIFPNFNQLFSDSVGYDSVWYYGYSYLFAYDYLGQLLPYYPIVLRGSSFGKPPCFSLDQGTNRLYMTVSSDITMPDFPDSVFLALYQYPDSTGPTDQWPTLSHDNLHTRNYSFIDRVTSIDDECPPPLPKSAILKQNYPNPFNTSTQTEFILPREEHINLSMYDIVGRKMVDITDGVYSAGSHKVNITLRDCSSGIYYLVLNTEDTQITRKLVLLK
jgi:hypothetical protein